MIHISTINPVRHRERSQGRHLAKHAAICLDLLQASRDYRSRTFAMTKEGQTPGS